MFFFCKLTNMLRPLSFIDQHDPPPPPPTTKGEQSNKPPKMRKNKPNILTSIKKTQALRQVKS